MSGREWCSSGILRVEKGGDEYAFSQYLAHNAVSGIVGVPMTSATLRGGGFNEPPGESTQPRDLNLLRLCCVTNNPLLWENGGCDNVTRACIPRQWSPKP